MRFNTLFLDFDGVLRLWSSSKISAEEAQCQVERGTLLGTAFSASFLVPAITGKISHREWHGLVRNELAKKLGYHIATCLLTAWEAEEWEIDTKLLYEIRRVVPDYRLVLVTNATDQLEHDLVTSGLESTFDLVVNSSEIGVAKPDVAFFQRALVLAECHAEESLYIDDSSSHVAAARTLGIHSIVHQTVADTVNFLVSKRL